jgi:hypothetical protein
LAEINSNGCRLRSKSSENVREELRVDDIEGEMLRLQSRLNDGSNLKG